MPEEKVRIEHDSMGEIAVPADKYWGAQTERSRRNFPAGAGHETMPEEILRAFAVLKKAAAEANRSLVPQRMTEEKRSAPPFRARATRSSPDGSTAISRSSCSRPAAARSRT